MQLIIFDGCATCPFLGTDIRGDEDMTIEHACTVSDDRIVVASPDISTEPPTVPPRWCPMRLERITVELSIRPDRTSN